jgi:hypothetical protein
LRNHCRAEEPASARHRHPDFQEEAACDPGVPLAGRRHDGTGMIEFGGGAIDFTVHNFYPECACHWFVQAARVSSRACHSKLTAMSRDECGCLNRSHFQSTAIACLTKHD